LSWLVRALDTFTDSQARLDLLGAFRRGARPVVPGHVVGCQTQQHQITGALTRELQSGAARPSLAISADRQFDTLLNLRGDARHDAVLAIIVLSC
jgi:hypothetical protein